MYAIGGIEPKRMAEMFRGRSGRCLRDERTPWSAGMWSLLADFAGLGMQPPRQFPGRQKRRQTNEHRENEYRR